MQGKVYHFAAGGLYDGLFLMRDKESGSYWNHITGECVYGPLTGAQLESGILHQMKAGQTANIYPQAQIAISSPKWWQNIMMSLQKIRDRTGDRGFLPPRFRQTMGKPDERLPQMEMGLGVWNAHIHRFYPRKAIVADNALFDELNGDKILVYIDPESSAPAAIYVNATGCEWQEQQLMLDTEESIRGGLLVKPDGTTQPLSRPQQLFTRWYGFAYTFPGCEIYGEKS